MLWQALSAFHFRMAGGYTGFAPPIPAEYERWPIVDALYDVAPIPDAGGQFKAFLKSHDVGAVIFAGEGDHAIEVSHAAGPGIWHRGPIAPRDREVWNVILGGLDVAAQNVGGVTLYQLARGGAGAMAQRASGRAPGARRGRPLRYAARRGLRLRRQWPQPPDLSPLAVQQAGLLPPNWVGGPLLRSSQTPGLMLDGLDARARAIASRRARGPGLVRRAQADHRQVPPVRGRDLFSLSARALRDAAARRRSGIDDDGIRRRPACARGPRGPAARGSRRRAAGKPAGDSRAVETLRSRRDARGEIATPRSAFADFDQPQPPDHQRIAIPKCRELRGRKQTSSPLRISTRWRVSHCSPRVFDALPAAPAADSSAPRSQRIRAPRRLSPPARAVASASAVASRH